MALLTKQSLKKFERLLMNKKPIISDENDIPIEDIFAHLPNSTSAFEVKYIEEGVDFNNYIDFYNAVYEQ